MKLTIEQKRRLHDGVCPRHRDTAPGVYVCGPCEAAGDAVVEELITEAVARDREQIAQAIESDVGLRLGHNVSVICSCLRCEVAKGAARIARDGGES